MEKKKFVRKQGRFVLFLMLLLLFPLGALAQQKLIKGQVVDEMGEPIIGATVKLDLLWSIAETFNGMMAIPNLIALFLLSGVVVKLVKERDAAKL